MALVLPKFPRRRASAGQPAVGEPLINLRLDRSEAIYQPGDQLVCSWTISSLKDLALDSVETSVLWYTEGKGDEDLGIHSFQRVEREDLERLFPVPQWQFSTQLPASPLSYEGYLVRIRWCVRLRIFRTQQKDIVLQQPFYLGPASCGL